MTQAGHRNFGWLALGALTACSTAVHTADFRIYTVNKQMQQSRALVLANAGKPGCHDMLIRQRVYRVAQVGFESCTIYAEKDCKPGTELSVRWKNKKEPTTTITPGARWFLPGERGEKMGSWSCVPRAPREKR